MKQAVWGRRCHQGKSWVCRSSDGLTAIDTMKLIEDIPTLRMHFQIPSSKVYQGMRDEGHTIADAFKKKGCIRAVLPFKTACDTLHVQAADADVRYHLKGLRLAGRPHTEVWVSHGLRYTCVKQPILLARNWLVKPIREGRLMEVAPHQHLLVLCVGQHPLRAMMH